MHNIFDCIPEILDEEIFQQLVDGDSVRIERIISRGHSSPESGWYDQDRNEWVLVLKGEAILLLEDEPNQPTKATGEIKIPEGRYDAYGQNLRVENGKLLDEPVKNTTEVLNEGQGGLMDVAVDPDYDENGWIYLAYSHVLTSGYEGNRPPAMTKIVRGKIENNTWTNEEVLFEAAHDSYRTTRHHYGCRIVFDPWGHLFFAIGDRGAGYQAQDFTLPNGKVHRIFKDGSIPEDNPFITEDGAVPSLFSLGNRNIKGMAIHPQTGELWVTEHGPMGGDELNLIEWGKNYGWETITYGKNYNGTIITDVKHKPGMEQPNLYWRPSIAVCGLDFYHGDLFSKWKNKLLVGALKYEEVRLLQIEGDKVVHQEVIVKNQGRVRDVSTGPEGAIYVVLNSPGTVIKLMPQD